MIILEIREQKLLYTRRQQFLVDWMHAITLYTEGCIGSSWKNFDSRSGSWVPCTYCGRCLNSSTLFRASDWLTIARFFAFSTRCTSSNCIRGWGASFFLSLSGRRSVTFFSEATVLAAGGTSFFWEALADLVCLDIAGLAPEAAPVDFPGKPTVQIDSDRHTQKL